MKCRWGSSGRRGTPHEGHVPPFRPPSLPETRRCLSGPGNRGRVTTSFSSWPTTSCTQVPGVYETRTRPGRTRYHSGKGGSTPGPLSSGPTLLTPRGTDGWFDDTQGAQTGTGDGHLDSSVVETWGSPERSRASQVSTVDPTESVTGSPVSTLLSESHPSTETGTGVGEWGVGS